MFSRFIVHKSSKESKNIYADIIEGGFIAATNSIFPMWLLWIREVMNENVNNVGENKWVWDQLPYNASCFFRYWITNYNMKPNYIIFDFVCFSKQTKIINQNNQHFR